MKKIIIYHNPKCSKSRQALTLLQENNMHPEVIEYLKAPLNKKQIQELLAVLKVPAIEIVRTTEQDFKALDLDKTDDSALIDAIAENAKLMQRPIVIIDDKAIIARPPEKIKELI